MVWLSVYFASAIVTAVAIFLIAEWSREPDIPAPECPGRCALLAGLIWPVLIAGVAQWVLIVAAQSWLRRSSRQSAALASGFNDRYRYRDARRVRLHPPTRPTIVDPGARAAWARRR